jgi:hypothetical protein
MDVMVDIETLGTEPGCVVLTVGACTMQQNPEDRSVFTAALDWETQVRDSRGVNPGTLKWWMDQSPEARTEAFEGDRVSVQDFADDFARWWWSVGAERIWSHGASFDVPILESLAPMPWKFWNVRDTRTLYSFAGVTPKRGNDHHHALADAMAQTDAVWSALTMLKLTNLFNQ